MFRLRAFPKFRLIFQTRALFTTNPDPQNSSKPLDSTAERSKFEDFTESFFEVLKQSKKNQPINKENKEGIDYQYSSRTIYHNKIDTKIFNSNNRTRFAIGTLWIVIGYATFVYIHPLITIIPAWFSSGSYLGYFMGNSYAKKLVSQIDLSEDQKNLMIKVVKGSKEIKAKIEDMDLFDIVELKERNPKRNEEKKISNNFVAVFDVKDEKGKMLNALRLFIEQNNITIENMDLFKYVLMGNQSEVDKFKFIEMKEKVKEEEKEAKEIDKKIEEEFERIKKEADEKK